MPDSAASLKAVLQAASHDQLPILANLLELYVHDFSEFYPVHLAADGRFGYPQLPLYWQEPGRFPFLITIGQEPAGLAFVRRLSIADHEHFDVAEFFIVRGYRRHGVGMQIAHDLFRRFPGAWQVRVMQSNRAADAFWQTAVSAFLGRPAAPSTTEQDERIWHVFRFDSPGC